MNRAWAVNDPVAIRDFVGVPWLLGKIVNIRPDGMLRIDLGAQPTAIRYPDDVRVVHADDVPIDERHWVPQSVRAHLARQAAAEQLRAIRDAMPLRDVHRCALTDMAVELDDLPAPNREPAPTP